MKILTILGLIYGLVVLSNFLVYLVVFFRDSSTPKTDCSSWVVLGLASVLWPIALPLSYLERRAKMRKLHTHCYQVQQLNAYYIS